MRRLGWVALIGVGIGMLGAGGASAASLPGAITLGKGLTAGAPQVLVDSKGTVNALWTGTKEGGFAVTHYSRKAKGDAHFTEVALPGMPSTDGGFIYEPSPGVLEIIVTVNGPLDIAAWASTNDGATWAQLPTTAQMKRGANGIYLAAEGLFEAPNGPLAYAGNNGDTGPIVQLNPTVSEAKTVGTNLVPGITLVHLGQTADATVFGLGFPTNDIQAEVPTTLPFQAGAVTGTVTFPCGGSKAVAQTDEAMAVGKSLAVVAFAGCGHVWTQTISKTGAIGPLTKIGASPGAASGPAGGRNGIAWVGLTADRSGGFTAAYSVPGNDVGISRSTDGEHWKQDPGFVPTQSAAPLYGADDWSLSRGDGAWIGLSPATGNEYPQRVMPVSEQYRRPHAPPHKGLKSARSGRLGSLAASVSGAIAKRSFHKTGKTTVKLVDALGGKVTTSLSVTRLQGETRTYLCTGNGTVKLKARKVKKVKLACANGAIVIGAPVDTHPIVKKGDDVAFTFTGRNGAVTIAAKIH